MVYLTSTGAVSILMGSEGNADQEKENLVIKSERKQHRHHSKSHKHRKNKAHHTSGGTAENDGLKKQHNKEKITGMRQLKPLISDNNKEYREFPKARGRRSTPDLSQWEKILNTLKQGEIKQSDADSVMESDMGKQLEILETIQHQLEEEIAKSKGTRHGHHKQHPSTDIEAKKEEIQVLKDIEDSLLQQTPPTEHNHAVTTGGHTHSNSHHHKHGQLQKATESKPLNDASNQVQNSHSHSHSKKPSTHTDATLNLDELEKQVFEDVLNAESDDGLTRKQGIELEREIESLEEIEKQTTEDLIEHSGPQTK